MSDLEKEIFEQAVDTAPEPTPEPVVREPEPQAEIPPEQPRDDKGRFAPKSETPAEPAPATPTAQPEPEDRGQIPAWRLREEAEAKREALKRAEAAEAERQRYQAELRQLQQRLSSLEKPPEPVKPPDPLLDPEGYQAFFDRQLTERLQNQQREFDMRLAHRTHGETFEKAYQEAQQAIASGDQQIRAMLENSNSPGETLVQWFKSRQTIREVGDDPNAWLERKLEERLNDPAFLAKAMERARAKASTPAPAVKLPPSLSSVSSAGAQVHDPDADDNSDAAVFRYALRR